VLGVPALLYWQGVEGRKAFADLSPEEEPHV